MHWGGEGRRGPDNGGGGGDPEGGLVTLSCATAQYHLAREEEELGAFGEGEGVNWQFIGSSGGGRTKGRVVSAGTWSGVECLALHLGCGRQALPS